MINLSRGTLAAVALLLATPQFAVAQLTDIPGFDKVLAQTQRSLDGNCIAFDQAVEMTQGDMRFYADTVDYCIDTNRMIATGNVLLIEADHQIAADRADFNAKTRLGTFYNARGFATIGPPPGGTSETGASEPDVQFYGETLEKSGEDTYIITNGGFTSCVQANPRWEMTSGSLKLRVDHYALLRNMFLKVKGVPAIYLPIMYYPLSKDNRNTGFLMPSYGSSTYKGQTISNAFFWAINRSQDATFLHDWFSKTGQAVAGEYRYVSLGGAGNIRSDFLNEHPTTIVGDDGEEIDQEGRADISRLRRPQPEPWRLLVRAGPRRLFERLACRSAVRHGHRPGNQAHENLRRIGEWDHQGHPGHRDLRPPGIFRREFHLIVARDVAAYQHRTPGSSPAGIADLRIGELGVRALRAETVRRGSCAGS